jgi:hypothetical protein
MKTMQAGQGSDGGGGCLRGNVYAASSDCVVVSALSSLEAICEGLERSFYYQNSRAHAHAHPHMTTHIRMRMDTGSSSERTEHSRGEYPCSCVHDGVKRLEMRHRS